jgi:transcriptional regulator with XRE-family HTH domain
LERLRFTRERLGYSQQDLANKSSVSQHTISEIELGRRKPQGRTLRKLATALRVEVADLYEGADHPLGEALPPAQPSFNGLLEEERRTIYLRAAIETVHGKAEAARWALEDVPSFAEAKGEYRPEQMLASWSNFWSHTRSDAHFLGRIWGEVVESVSRQATPADEEALVDKLHGELRSFDDIVERLGKKVNAEFEAFRQQRRDAELLAPNVDDLMSQDHRSEADATTHTSEAG